MDKQLMWLLAIVLLLVIVVAGLGYYEYDTPATPAVPVQRPGDHWSYHFQRHFRD